MTFSQQPKGLKTVFYVFFKSLKSKKLILRVNLSEFGVSEGPTFFRLKNDPKNTWNMFIGSIRNPMQKFGDGPFFFFFGPFCQVGYQTVDLTLKMWTDYLSNPLVLEPIFHSTIFFHGHLRAGPRCGICPYQLARALNMRAHICKKLWGKVTIFITTWTQ